MKNSKIKADNINIIAGISGINSMELELAAALEGNGCPLDTLSFEQIKDWCEKADILHEIMDATAETMFTLYDLIEAILYDPDRVCRDKFMSDDDWYEAVRETAKEQRRKYS